MTMPKSIRQISFENRSSLRPMEPVATTSACTLTIEPKLVRAINMTEELANAEASDDKVFRKLLTDEVESLIRRKSWNWPTKEWLQGLPCSYCEQDVPLLAERFKICRRLIAGRKRSSGWKAIEGYCVACKGSIAYRYSAFRDPSMFLSSWTRAKANQGASSQRVICQPMQEMLEL